MSIRIRRLHVRDVGPLRDFTLEPGDLTVVHGGNEAGKTSCIDALLRGLRERVRPGNRRMLDQSRDGPGFAGAVELRLDPPDGGPLVELLREHPSLARLFVVRDGDATLDSGRTWLDSIRGRLVGVDLARISDRVRMRAGLTPGGSPKAASVAERERSAGLLSRIEAFVADLPAIDGLLDERARVERERASLRDRIDRLREAERWERHRLVVETRSAARAAAERAAALGGFRTEDLAAWREAVAVLREAAALAKNAEFNASVLAEQATLESNAVRECTAAVERVEDLREEYRRRGLPELVAEARERARGAQWWSRLRAPAGAAGALLLATGVALGLRVTGSDGGLGVAGDTAPLQLAIAAGAAAACGLLAAVLALLAAVRVRAAEAADADTVEACGAVLLDVSDLESCAAHLDAIDDDIQAADAQLAAVSARRDAARARVDTARRQAAVRAVALDAAQRAVGDVRQRTGLPGLADLEARLRERTEAEATAAEARRTLASLLGDDATIDEAGRDAAPAPPDPGTPADHGALTDAERRLRELDDTSMRLRAALVERRDRALASMGLADISGVESERTRIGGEVDAIDRGLRAGRLCLEALSELALDFDRPLREALGDGPAAAGSHLARLTGGRWGKVHPDGDGLVVEREDGLQLPSESLSRGARDQLALAVRLALVRRLVGQPAFLVLDDAFLTSDAARRDALAAAVADLAGDGWQILFFTFDDAMRDRFAALGAQVVALTARSGSH